MAKYHINWLKGIEFWIIKGKQAMADRDDKLDEIIAGLKLWVSRHGKPPKGPNIRHWRFWMGDNLIVPYKDARSQTRDAWRQARKLWMRTPGELKADAKELSANLQAYGSLFTDDLSALGSCRDLMKKYTDVEINIIDNAKHDEQWKHVITDAKIVIKNLEWVRGRFKNYKFDMSLKLTMDLLAKFEGKVKV